MADAEQSGARPDKTLIMPDGLTDAPEIPADFVPEPKAIRPITLKLVMENSLPTRELAEFSSADADEALKFAGELKTLHLEWQGIAEITNLEAFDGAETIYIQWNQIRRIEGLESMMRLQFLALQNNRISKVENLLHLEKLSFLDLSKNQIEDLDEDELPISINILNLRENPCTADQDYQQNVLARLPDLCHLDGAVLPDRMEEQQKKMAQEGGDLGIDIGPASLLTRAEAEELLGGDVSGLTAYWHRGQLRDGLSTAVDEKIEAYCVEMLNDVDGVGRSCEDMVGRSKARQKKIETAGVSEGVSLTEEQLTEVRRIKAAIEKLEKQKDFKAYVDSKAAAAS